MAKIVSRLAKNLVSSGRILQLQHINHAAFNSDFEFRFHSNSSSNSDSNFSTTTTTNILYTYKKDDCPLIQVSKLRYPIIDDELVCFKYVKDKLRICSHSHGIVCFSDRDKYIILFNPFTRNFLTLEPPPLLPFQIHDHYYDSGVGFYYKPNVHFKVFRFVNFETLGKFQNILVHVYHSKTGWRQIFSPPVECPFPCFNGKDVVLNGVHYWLTYTVDQEFIQSFDMEREVFNPLIPISNASTYNVFEENCELHVWNGSIVLFSCGGGYGDMFQIWALEKDQSGAYSLSELFTFDSHSILNHPLLFVNSDELLMKAKAQQVVSYNLKTQAIKYLPFKADQVSLFENSPYTISGGFVL